MTRHRSVHFGPMYKNSGSELANAARPRIGGAFSRPVPAHHTLRSSFTKMLKDKHVGNAYVALRRIIAAAGFYGSRSLPPHNTRARVGFAGPFDVPLPRRITEAFERQTGLAPPSAGQQDVLTRGLSRQAQRSRTSFREVRPQAAFLAEIFSVMGVRISRGTIYRLLARFGSAANVLAASSANLLEIVSLDANQLEFIAFVRRATWQLARFKFDPRRSVENVPTLLEYLRLRYGQSRVNTIITLYTDNDGRILSEETLAHGDPISVHLHCRELGKRALQVDATALIVARTTSGNRTIATEDDLLHIRAVERTLTALNMRMLDYILVGKSVSRSMFEAGLV